MRGRKVEVSRGLFWIILSVSWWKASSPSAVASSLWFQSRGRGETRHRVLPREVLWVSLLPTLFADRTLLAAAYALHVSELCTLWIFNEPCATFFPDRYRETARKNSRTLRSELIYETGRMWRLNVARFRCTWNALFLVCFACSSCDKTRATSVCWVLGIVFFFNT